MKPLIFLTACVLALSACRSDETPRALDGSKKVWVLKTLNGAIFPATATLSIPEPGEINGQGPCNRYFGGLSGTYPAFRAGPIGSTKIACPKLKAETAFLDSLQAATTAMATKERLILTNNEGLEMVFIPDG